MSQKMVQYLCLNVRNTCVLQAVADNLRAKGITDIGLIDWLIFISIKLLFQRSINEPTRITLIPLIVSVIARRYGYYPVITVPRDTREFLTLAAGGLESWLVKRSWRRVREISAIVNILPGSIFLLRKAHHATYLEYGRKLGGPVSMVITLRPKRGE